MNDVHAPNDITRYNIGPGPTRCGIHGTVIVDSRCADCDEENCCDECGRWKPSSPCPYTLCTRFA